MFNMVVDYDVASRFYDDTIDAFDVAYALSQELPVLNAEVNGIVRATSHFPHDPAWNPIYGDEYCWAMKRIQAHHAWDFYKDGVLDNAGDATVDNVVLVIADTGVMSNHEDIVVGPDRNIVFNNLSASFINYLSNNQYITNYHDVNGHGTMVAGIAAAQGNNGLGLAGVAWNPKIVSLKVLNDMGRGTSASIANSLYYIAAELAPIYSDKKFIANYSLGSKQSSNTIKDAAYEANKEPNVLLVASAGNDGLKTQFWPASYPEFVSVGASSRIQVEDSGVLKDIEVYDACPEQSDGSGGTKKWGTNWHGDVDVCAPGSASSPSLDANITTTSFPDNLIFPTDQTVDCPSYNCTLPYYCEHFLGTSASAPHVTGLAALLWSKYPDATKGNIVDRIKNTADPMHLPQEKQGELGTGRINAFRALPKGYPVWAEKGISWDDSIGYGITTNSYDKLFITGLIEKHHIFIASYYNDVITLIDYINCTEPIGGILPSSGYGITTLSDNSIVVTGRFNGHEVRFGGDGPDGITLSSKGHSDIFIAKYNPNDTLAWAKSAGGVAAYIFGRSITTLSDDSVVITGRFRGEVTFGEKPDEETLTAQGLGDIFIAKYNKNGIFQWVRSPSGEGWNQGLGITTLSDDSIVVTGFFRDEISVMPLVYLESKGERDIFIARYASSGVPMWGKSAGGTGDNVGHGITTLSDNSVVVTGWFEGDATFGEGEGNQTTFSIGLTSHSNIFIARYNPDDGTLAWAKQAGSSGPDKGYGITALPDDTTVVTGNFNYQAYFGEGEPNQIIFYGPSGPVENFFIARYNQDGTLLWATRESSWFYYGKTKDSTGMEIVALSDNSTAVTGYFVDTATFGEKKDSPKEWWWLEHDEYTLTHSGSINSKNYFVTGFAP